MKQSIRKIAAIFLFQLLVPCHSWGQGESLCSNFFGTITSENIAAVSKSEQKLSNTMERESSRIYTEVGIPYIKKHSDNLAIRLKSGDITVPLYLEMGWTLSNDGKMLLPPEDYRTFMRAYLKAQEQFPESERIYPAFKFIRGRGRNYEYQYRRILVDGPPEGKGWKLVASPDYVSLSEWSKEMQAGRMPTPIGQPIIHDMAHLVEYTQFPALRKKVREYFYDPKVADPEQYDDDHPWVLRLYEAQEYGAIPNPFESKVIQETFPDLFRKDGPLTLDENIERITKLSERELKREIADLVENREKFLLRSGGSTRDGESMTQKDIVEWAANQNKGQLRRGPRTSFTTSTIERTLDENTYIFVAQVEQSADYLGLYETSSEIRDYYLGELNKVHMGQESLRQGLRKIMIDKLARAQMVLKTGINLEITQQDLLYKTSRSTAFFKSFTRPGDLLYDIYVLPGHD